MNRTKKIYIQQALFTVVLLAAVFLLFPRHVYAEQTKQNENYKYCYNKKYKGIEIMSYLGTELAVNVPDKIDGRPVTVIGKKAFYEKDVEEVALPESVILLKEEAFCGCGNMKKIILPDNLEKMERAVFYSCISLETIDLPESLTEIPNSAFFFSGLKKIQIPKKVKYIGWNVFCICKNLETVIFPKNSNLEKIGDEAFMRCYNLEELIFPDSLQVIGDAAFDYNYKLKKVTFGKKSKLKELKGCFSECSSLDTIIIPKNVRLIGCETFSYCKKLRHITFLGSVPKIESAAFKDINKRAIFKVPSKYKTKYKKALTKETGFLKKTMRIRAV